MEHNTDSCSIKGQVSEIQTNSASCSDGKALKELAHSFDVQKNCSENSTDTMTKEVNILSPISDHEVISDKCEGLNSTDAEVGSKFSNGTAGTVYNCLSESIVSSTNEKGSEIQAELQIDHVEQRLSKEDKSSGTDVLQENCDNKSDDPELDSLLDDALQDFGKVLPSQQVQGQGHSCSAAAGAAGQSGAHNDINSQSQEEMFNEVFNVLSNQSPDDRMALEAIFKSLTIGHPGPDVNTASSQSDAAVSSSSNTSTTSSAAAAAATAAGSSNGSAAAAGGNLWDTLQETLNGLASNAEGLESDELSDEDFMRLMASLGGDSGEGSEGLAGLLGGLGAAEGGDPELFPLMQGMMKNLLSREVLYPSLKEITTKYPGWLAANKSIADPEAYTK